MSKPTWQFVFDAYEGKTLTQMKQRANELCTALDHWQETALLLAEKHGTEGLDAKRAKEVNDLLESQRD